MVRNPEQYDLNELELDLRGAPMRVQLRSRGLMRKSAELVATGMKKDARGHRYLPHLPRSVDWEWLTPLTVEVGLSRAIRGKQGKLAHIIVFGSVNNAPVYDHLAALRRSEPQILEWAGDAGESSVLGDDRR